MANEDAEMAAEGYQQAGEISFADASSVDLLAAQEDQAAVVDGDTQTIRFYQKAR